MAFLIIGVLALLMKFMEFGPVATLPWWMVLSPFGLAVAWWAWADKSGYTKRAEIKKMEERRLLRIDKQREAMGTLTARRRK
jgi:small Trp-rich protein